MPPAWASRWMRSLCPVRAAAWSRASRWRLKGAGSAAFVHSVEPENFDGMRRSLQQAHARSTAPGGKLSIADALMAPTPGHHVFAVADGLLAPGLAVSDDELDQAVAFAATRLKLLVEPGGAAALGGFSRRQDGGQDRGPGDVGRQCRFLHRGERRQRRSALGTSIARRALDRADPPLHCGRVNSRTDHRERIHFRRQ